MADARDLTLGWLPQPCALQQLKTLNEAGIQLCIAA